jgi:hypothetical protein
MSTNRISPIPATLGLALLTAAIGLQVEDALRAWHFTSTDALPPIITLAVAASGVLAHHRLARWQLVSGTAYLLMAILGSGVIVYGSLARTATQRDTAIATAMAENRTLSLREEELASAKALAKAECKVVGERCRSQQARADQLIGQMAGLRAVAADPRSDAIARLAELLGGNAAKVRAIVGAIDAAVLPIMCELLCILMLCAGFPASRSNATERKSDASVTQVSVLNQRDLAKAWGVHESTVCRRLQKMEAAGQVRRQRQGRAMLTLPAPAARA